MTRQEIEQEYKIENGIIRSPGKFEGEMLYVPYFWDCFLNGGADNDEDGMLSFIIEPTDRVMFPELPIDQEMIHLIEREDGFVFEQ